MQVWAFARNRCELTSASGASDVLAASLGHIQRGEGLGAGGMNAHGHVKVLLGGAEFDGDGEALRDLARVGSGHVQADDALLVELVADELRVAHVVRSMGHGPLQGPVVDVVHFDVLVAQRLDGLLLGEADVAVLERGEHGGGHGVVVHFDVAAAE